MQEKIKKNMEPIKSIKMWKNNIAVISANKEDFIQWRVDNKLESVSKQTVRNFQIGNTIYWRILSIGDLKGINMSWVISTELAKTNENYNEIIDYVKNANFTIL